MTADLLLIIIEGENDDEGVYVLVPETASPRSLTEVVHDEIAGYGAQVVARPREVARRGISEILVAVAVWASTSAAWDLAKALVGRLGQHLSGATVQADDTLGPTEAEARARWLVAVRFDEDERGLVTEELTCSVPVSEGDHSTATVILTSARGWTYTVRIEVHDGLVLTAQVRRVRDPRPDGPQTRPTPGGWRTA